MPEIESAVIDQAAPVPEQVPDGFDYSKLEASTERSDGMPVKPPTAAAKPEPRPEQAKPAEKPPEKAAAQPAAEQARPQTDAARPPAEAGKAEAAPARKSAWQLVREREKELAELRGKHEMAEKELSTLKAKPATPLDDPEKKQLAARLQELEGEIQLKNFEKSDKYQKEYYEPWVKAHNNAIQEATELMVETPDEVGGEVKIRGVTQNEAYSIVTAPTKEDAIRMARKIFPSDSDADKRNALVATRKEAYGALTKLWGAKEEFRAKGAEWEKQNKLKEEQERTQSQAQKERDDAARQSKWQEMNEVALKNDNLKEFFQAADDDAKGKELLTKGFKAADMAFGIGERDAEGNLLGSDGQPLGEDALIAAHSAVRNKAGAFNYVAHQYRNLKAKVADLEKELANYRASEPGEGGGKAKPTGDGEGYDLDAEIRKLAGR